jgi:hypothetical protein
MTQTYYIAETADGAHITDSHFKATKAKTFESAKRAAQRNRAFQGTCAHVAVLEDGHFEVIATRVPGHGWIENSDSDPKHRGGFAQW